jgi:hypothetical protein
MRRLRSARTRVMASGVLSLLLGCMATTPALAEVVIYRCTDASGAVTLQNGTPCPKGSKQQKKVMETPPPAPPAAPMPPATIAPPVVPASAPTPMAAPAIVEPSPSTPPQVAVAKTPPPALFECRTWNRDRYFSEDAHPPQRCAPLEVTGLDGSGAMAGGTACQMMDDQCQPVSEAALCDAWQQRLRELDATAAFATGATTTQAEGERIRRIVSDSTCTP